MNIIQPTVEILRETPDLLEIIEYAGRTCYKSNDKITDDSASKFIEKMKSFKHLSVLEHGAITVKFVTDRGVTHELVRHRIANFSQSSTRYCNYSKGKFNNEITVINPFFFSNDSHKYYVWKKSCEQAETAYMELIIENASAQEARSVLPNSLATEIIMTANPREWRHVLELRTHHDAHPQIRQICCPLLKEFQNRYPVLFSDIGDTNHIQPAEML